jgi:hypothetical protein
MPVRQGAAANADDVGAYPVTQLARGNSQAANHMMCRAVILVGFLRSGAQVGQ